MALGAFFSAGEVHPADVPDRRGVELPAARRRARVHVADAVPAPLGGHVPGRRRLLELPRRRRLRLPHQPADRLLLRDRHRADRQPRPRRDDGRLRHAGDRPGAVLPALPDPGRAMAGAVGAICVLVDQHRPGLDVLRHAAPARASCSSTSRSNSGYFEARSLGVPDATTPTRSSSGCASPATSSSSSAGRSPSSTSPGSVFATPSSASPSKSPRTFCSPSITEPAGVAATGAGAGAQSS